MKNKKQRKSYNLGINLEPLSIQIQTPEAVEAVKQLFVSQVNSEGTSGNGILKYTGNYYFQDKLVFIGACQTTKNRKIQFIGADSLPKLQEFLNAYSNFSTALQENFTLSTTSFTYYCPPFSNISELRAFVSALEQTVQLQVSQKPNVSYAKGELIIGSKKSSSSQCVTVTYESVNANNLSGILTRAKVAGAGAKALWQLIVANANSNIESCLASYSVDLLGKVTLSPILIDIRNDISKNYAIGKVEKALPKAKGEGKSSTRAGTYVLKSLTGIKNKLKDPLASKEIISLLEAWLLKLVLDTALPNHSSLIKAFKEVLSGKAAKAAIKRSSSVSPEEVVAASESSTEGSDKADPG